MTIYSDYSARHKSRCTYLALAEWFTANRLVFQDILDLVPANKSVAKEI